MTSNHEASPSVDPDLLAGYVEGRLDDDERAAVEARLVHDEEARALVGELRAALGTEAPVPVPATPGWVPLAIAACALLAIGALVFAMTREDLGPLDPYARLLATADRLATADPVQFGSLRATIEDASLIGEAEAMRGGLRIFAPQGALLEGRPQLQWAEVPGSKGYEVRVATVTGAEVLTFLSETATASWPDEAEPLAGGQQYLLRSGPKGRLASARARRCFAWPTRTHARPRSRPGRRSRPRPMASIAISCSPTMRCAMAGTRVSRTCWQASSPTRRRIRACSGCRRVWRRCRSRHLGSRCAQRCSSP